jgi:hypothetical protein
VSQSCPSSRLNFNRWNKSLTHKCIFIWSWWSTLSMLSLLSMLSSLSMLSPSLRQSFSFAISWNSFHQYLHLVFFNFKSTESIFQRLNLEKQVLNFACLEEHSDNLILVQELQCAKITIWPLSAWNDWPRDQLLSVFMGQKVIMNQTRNSDLRFISLSSMKLKKNTRTINFENFVTQLKTIFEMRPLSWDRVCEDKSIRTGNSATGFSCVRWVFKLWKLFERVNNILTFLNIGLKFRFKQTILRFWIKLLNFLRKMFANCKFTILVIMRLYRSEIQEWKKDLCLWVQKPLWPVASRPEKIDFF